MSIRTCRAFFGKGGREDVLSDLAARLLSEAHVVVVPGEAFGTAEHIRLSPMRLKPEVIR